MTTDERECKQELEHDDRPHVLVRVRVTTDGDPSVLPRLLGYFHNLNVSPRQVKAEFGSTVLMHLSVDICGLPEERVSLITAKIAHSPCVLNAYWHYL
jgi:hypothetical protein